LIYQMSRDEDVLGRLRAARELSRFRNDDAVWNLSSVLMGDDFYGVRMAAAISLGEIASPAALPVLIESYRSNSDPRIRRACIWAFGNFKDSDSQEERINILQEALEKDESYFVGVAAVRALANIGGEKAFDILKSALNRSSWQEVIAASVFHGLSHAKDRRALDIAFEMTEYGKPLPIRVAAISYLGSVGKELRKENADQKIVDHLTGLLKDLNIRARVTAVRALGKIGNPRALPALHDSQQLECLDMLKAAIEDAIKSISDKDMKK